MKRSKLWLLLLLAAALAGVLLAARLTGGRRPASPRSEAGGPDLEMSALRGEIDGVVVYEHRGGVYKTVIGRKEGIMLAAKGRYPRWAPDGGHVAFLRGDRLMRMNADGGDVEPLQAVEDPRAVAYHPNGKEILFTDGKKIRSHLIDSREVRTVVKGSRLLEIDVSSDGARLVGTGKGLGFRIYAFDLQTGERRKLAAGCSASLSPDGRLVSCNNREHTRLALLSWERGEEEGAIPPPPRLRFDNHFWSNGRDWIASRSEGEHEDIYLHRVSTGRAYRVTFSGDCDRPDLFLRSP